MADCGTVGGDTGGPVFSNWGNQILSDERTGMAAHVLCSGKFEGVRVSDIDREELTFEARRGCCRYRDRAAMRVYISTLSARRLWFDGKWERRIGLSWKPPALF